MQNFVNKEDVQQFGSDIRYIHSNADNGKAKVESGLVYGSLAYWLFYLIPLLIAVVLLIIFRKQIRDNSDITRVRIIARVDLIGYITS